MIRYRSIVAITLIATLVHVLAGCVQTPADERAATSLDVAREQAARIDEQTHTIATLVTAAGGYVSDTGTMIDGAIDTLSTGVAGSVSSAIVQLGKAHASNDKTAATIATLQTTVAAQVTQNGKLAGTLVGLNGELREMQRERATDRQKFTDALQRKQDRIDEVESSFGYQAEVWVKRIWFWSFVGFVVALLIGLLGGPIGAMIGGPVGGGLSWLSTVVMHVGTLGATKILKVILSWRSAAKAAT